MKQHNSKPIYSQKQTETDHNFTYAIFSRARSEHTNLNCKIWNIRATVARVPYTKVLTLLNGTVQTMRRFVCTVQFQMWVNYILHNIDSTLTRFVCVWSLLYCLFCTKPSVHLKSHGHLSELSPLFFCLACSPPLPNQLVLFSEEIFSSNIYLSNIVIYLSRCK